MLFSSPWRVRSLLNSAICCLQHSYNMECATLYCICDKLYSHSRAMLYPFTFVCLEPRTVLIQSKSSVMMRCYWQSITCPYDIFPPNMTAHGVYHTVQEWAICLGEFSTLKFLRDQMMFYSTPYSHYFAHCKSLRSIYWMKIWGNWTRRGGLVFYH